MAPPAKRKIRLTDISVKKLKEGRTWDKEIGGFGVKVYPSGKRQFILRYKSPDKKQREFRIGQFGVISADEARQKAKILIGKISEGADPQWERKIGLAEAKTFNTLIDKYLAYASENHKPTSLKEVQTHSRLHIRKHFGDIPCQKISKGLVQRIYGGLQQSPHYRAKIIQWSRIIWGWAEKRELVGEQRNPFCIETKVPAPKRSRILSEKEYRQLWEAIEKYRFKGVIPKISLLAMEMLILTPLRKNECFQLRWEYIHLEDNKILVTEHKTDRYAQPLE
jgi:integrase